MSIDHRGGTTLHGAVVAQHEWVAPPPGTGRLRVCKHCGIRETADAKQIECIRQHFRDHAPVAEYDPYSA